MEENTRDLAVYVLLRTDLPSMNPGKAAAQVHHAGVQMMATRNKNQLVKEYVDTGSAQGANGFNTTLVLGATIEDIFRVQQLAENQAVPFDHVKDPSYPFFVENMEIASLIPQGAGTAIVKVMDNGKVLMVRPEITCAWFLIDRNDSVSRSLFDGLDLHP